MSKTKKCELDIDCNNTSIREVIISGNFSIAVCKDCLKVHKAIMLLACAGIGEAIMDMSRDEIFVAAEKEYYKLKDEAIELLDAKEKAAALLNNPILSALLEQHMLSMIDAVKQYEEKDE